jgi:hypothetical protein
MKLASLRSLAALTLSAGAVLVACSSGDSGSGEFNFGDGGTGSSGSERDSGGGGNEYDSGGGGDYDSGSNEDTGTTGGGDSGGGTCGACTTDQECQSSCPPVSGGQGTNCCDVGSGVCYATTQSTCPTPSDGGTE